MTENQNSSNGMTPKLQKRLAAAKKNRRRRQIGHVITFISTLLMVAGGIADGFLRELFFIVAFVLLPVGGWLLSTQEVSHG